MNGARAVWIIVLVGCSACTVSNRGSPSPESPTRAGYTGTAYPARVAGFNPHTCEDEPKAEREPSSPPIVWDDAIASLAPCTKNLTASGNLEVALLYEENTATGRPFATHSTVADCRVVACIKEHLAGVQRASSAPMKKDIETVQLNLVPGTPVHRAFDVDWTHVKSDACTDPNNELGEFSRGRLEAKQIQSVIRGRYEEFRKCYASGLASNPGLSGELRIRFIIERDGQVSHAYIRDNEVPDCQVAQCIREAMTKLVFPRAEGGPVTVVYPIGLSPG